MATHHHRMSGSPAAPIINLRSDILDGMQRCGEHILRDADAQGSDRPEDRRRTYQLPRHVCTGAPAEPAPHRPAREPGAYRMYVRQATEMAGQSPKFGQKLARAMPDLLMCVLHDLEPANNRTERATRFVAGSRNICTQVCSRQWHVVVWHTVP